MAISTTEHIVKSFETELRRLDAQVVEMGGAAEAQLAEATDALVKRDPDKAMRVTRADRKIDDHERRIDDMAVRLFALRQPMADDLRIVISALKSANALERIGDYSKNIAKRTIALAESPPLGPVNTIARMSHVVQSMLKGAIDAYVTRDVELASDVRARDEDVDALHTTLFRELLTYMMEDPRNITPCTHLLFVAKNIERIGDHATNIADNVHFMVLGKKPAGPRTNRDGASFAVVAPPANEPAAGREDRSAEES